MGKTAILAIRIIGDATSAVTSLESVDGGAKSMQATMDKASVGAGVALGALTAAATVAGNAASELQQATGAVDSVFGTYAGRIHDYANEAADAVGLSESAYSNMAVVIGSQLKNMGLSVDESASQTQDLIGLGSDLAAMFGGTTSDAVSALSSLLRGERDPIERYGVSINQAAIDAEKAALGLEGLTGEADKNANLQATLALLTRQTADAQGTFAKESDTAAGQQQRMNATWENTLAMLGEQLLPLMTEGAAMLATWAEWAGDNTEVVTLLAGSIGALSAGILIVNGAMKAYAAVQAIATAATWASNAAWLANPITIIILAIIAAIAAVIAIGLLIVNNWDEIKRKADEVWGGVIRWVQDVGRWFDNVFGRIGGWWEDVMGLNGQTFSARMVLEQEPPMIASSRMAFSADETMQAYAQPAPTSRTTAGLSGTSSDVGRFAGTARPDRGGDTYVNIRFDGLVTDPEGTARAIRKVLDDSDRTSGRKPAAGVPA